MSGTLELLREICKLKEFRVTEGRGFDVKSIKILAEDKKEALKIAKEKGYNVEISNILAIKGSLKLVDLDLESLQRIVNKIDERKELFSSINI